MKILLQNIDTVQSASRFSTLEVNCRPGGLRRTQCRGFTLMEMLVVIAIIVILAAIAFPVIGRFRANSNKAVALNIMRQLASAVAPFAAQNDGDLPSEDTESRDGWKEVSEPAADRAWYNSLLRQLNQKTVSEFAKYKEFEAYYSKQNFLFLAGADYPNATRRLERPLFAIAMNTKLHRRKESDDAGQQGEKPPVKLASVLLQTRTVAFLEQGLPGEVASHPTISAREDYDGSPKGSAKSFVARYTGKGTLAFMDGHAEEAEAKNLLNGQGEILWEEDWLTKNPSGIFWTADPKEDPNS